MSVISDPSYPLLCQLSLTLHTLFDYENDEIGRRTAISRSGTTFDVPVRDAYGYNARSEVTSARRNLASNPSQEVRGFSYDYAYDPIGNRTSSTEYDHENNALVSSYTANELNQYYQRTVPGYAGVRGSAPNTATVTVNGNAAWRLGEYFYGGDDADNAASAVMKELETLAVVNPPGTNTPDLVESATGRVFVAQSPETLTYDDDGNLLSDGRFIYTWDGENRLTAVETRSDLPTSVPRVRVEYLYDHRSRRIEKQSYTWATDHWTLTTDNSFTYDSWNVVRETINHQQLVTNYYTWGLDLSGSLQGAGGIGGLLAASLDGTTAFYCYDANGNVGQLVSSVGELLAHYEYSPFGETVVSTGPLAKANPFRFSTKPWDDLTELGYWGYRYYHPDMGRWVSRDPIGEIGALNVYSFDLNDLVDRYDAWGFTSTKAGCDQNVQNAFEKKDVSDLVVQLKKRNCKIPKVGCKCCSDRDLGGYYRPKFLFWGNTITMCYNNLGGQADYDIILEHEMFHALQTCYEEKEDNRCKTSVCEEIEAYYNTNCAHLADPEARKKCVQRGVGYSSADHCKKWFGLGSVNQGRIDHYFWELYDKCKTRNR